MKELDQMPEPKKRRPLYRRAAEVQAEEGTPPAKPVPPKQVVSPVSGLVKKSKPVVGENSPDPSTSGGGSGVSASRTEVEQRPDPTKTTGEPTTMPKPFATTNAGVIASNAKSSGLAARIAQVESSRPKVEGQNIIVKALAGTGKTTTLIGGLNRCYGIAADGLVPSPQQAAVWAAMMETMNPRAAQVTSFSVSIVDVLKQRIPKGRGCDAKTLHGMGSYHLWKNFKLSKDPSEYRVDEIVAELMNVEDIRQFRKEKPALMNAVKELVGLCKVNLSEADEPSLNALVRHYDVDMPDSWNEVFDLVPRVLDRCKDVVRDGYVDFDDMLWLPIVLNLPIFKNDLMLVDEAQDLNRCQQEFARRAGKRLILCGDPNQSIFGFAGADSDSMPRMLRELTASERGCRELPLTVTRRCGKAIVEEAKFYVPDFEAHESNPEGKVDRALYPIQQRVGEDGRLVKFELPYEKTYMPKVRAGDMILCRANAPLLNQCFRFLKRGQKAFVQGRKVGDSLLALLEKLNPTTVQDLIARVADWQHKELSKEAAQRNPSENRMAAIVDRGDCLMAFAVEASNVSDVRSKIESIFTDNEKSPGIKFSSIHRAKGLESDRVFYIQGFGRPMDKIKNEWEKQQERNLGYVATTRAKEELVYVE